MDPEFLKLFGTMMAIMIPVGVGGGVFVLIASLAKRRGKRRIPSASSEDFGTVLDTVERMEAQLQQVEERLDFIERVLPALREGKLLLEAPARSRQSTPP